MVDIRRLKVNRYWWTVQIWRFSTQFAVLCSSACYWCTGKTSGFEITLQSFLLQCKGIHCAALSTWNALWQARKSSWYRLSVGPSFVYGSWRRDSAAVRFSERARYRSFQLVLSYLLTHSLTRSMQPSPSWEANRSVASKVIHAFYETRRFITVVTEARHLSLSWASSIQSIPSHPTSWRYILILSFHLLPGLPSGLFPSGFPTKPCIRLSCPPYAPHAPPIVQFYTACPIWLQFISPIRRTGALSTAVEGVG